MAEHRVADTDVLEGEAAERAIDGEMPSPTDPEWIEFALGRAAVGEPVEQADPRFKERLRRLLLDRLQRRRGA